MTKQLFYDIPPAEVPALMERLGQPAYRARQILHNVYKRLVPSFAEMTDLPRSLRMTLEDQYTLAAGRVLGELTAIDKQTHKALIRLPDGEIIETVLMLYDPRSDSRGRATVCVSSQAGCAMGCVFCATGQQGFRRNLTAGEIVAQAVHFARKLAQDGKHLTNVVFMGMGEPLANYTQTIRAVRLLTHPRAFGLAQRHITISTVGVLSGIEKLAEEGLQVGLAISLHAPNDELRQRLIPTAAPGSVARLIEAARRFRERTKRRVTVEYVLIDGVNDELSHALELARLLRGSDIHVNLIPLNPTAVGFRRPSPGRVGAFANTLRRAGVNCTVRQEKGTAISAACGQLRTDAERAVVSPALVARLTSPRG